ncbi:MAG TPA: hypothetical protein VF533_18785 [Solirubrobacteraceae bacterium]|jgi:hypothetical protein
MPRPTLPSLLLAALAAAALLPAGAHAAFAPKLAIAIDPPAPDRPTALTSTITQASGETPIKRVVLTLPPGFGPVLGSRFESCSDQQKSARTCPEGSRLGTANAQTQLGAFAGNVYYGQPTPDGPRLFVFLSNGVSFFDQTIEGAIKVTADGYQTIFDNLPNVETSSFRLALEGGQRALIKTPRACGDSLFKGELTAQDGQTATAEAPVTVGPCPNKPPYVVDVAVARKGKAVRFRLSEPAQVAVQVKHGKKVVRRASLAGAKGDNEVRIKRVRKPGRYRVVVRATDPEGATGAESARLVVRKAKKKRR